MIRRRKHVPLPVMLGVLLAFLPGGLFLIRQTVFHSQAPSPAGALLEAELSARGRAGKTEKSNLPVHFDWRTQGKAPTVKSQGTRGTCWALTATSALEAAFLPGAAPVFSADHMSLNNGFVISQSEGGDYKMIMAYLSGWYGPVLEEEDPYGDDQTVSGLDASAHVQQMLLLEGAAREDFQEMIYRYGPVQTSLYMDRKLTAGAMDYYNEETFAYYYPEEHPVTHDVLLLGWDDSFPAERFLLDPGVDGAFICQNTWGTRFGDEGVFYVSYADANLAGSGLAYPRVETADNYDHIYQTDVCGWQGRQGYDQPDCCFANVYEAQGEEELAAAGFYSLGERSGYRIYVVHDFASADSFPHRTLLTEGVLEGIGFFTVDFPEPEPLQAGERFALVVEISTPGTGKPVAVEMKKDAYTARVSLEGKESYLSLYGGSWERTQKDFSTNVCLKAYTKDATDRDDRADGSGNS